MARDRAFRSNSFGISTTIAFAFVIPNSFTFVLEKTKS
ncbi:hypothetical protein LEP1GSC034_4844 [Leptospira interrogans str. 2003000735]|uniref:Uncharacterized protein n=4 Tax=Leptospira interrogans TaxID=173 RepID=M6RP91_LEPIR|nr:hypothetical protein LEP1GSC027_1476 [Leptospira interrogans str. 2002000624]EKQ35931.1 hypothetical protein LEP1GSC025_3268 [Leptospira interrogans str. 2002000621]EKQ45799.1 hypothetical protein LEP1GSC026_1574 [Leptospira interrogans str. 2002000623]EMG21601.1 hypothetical protein LEP1GSC150_1434 [Leptospira interrogans serovar Copenhageni str. LT2050]EMJ71713.1 hypothetical protein LEP1GSC033_3589 [Leptospira interrogans str. 2002000632]EMJ74957.1 hypothetical protein LEP1GSC034_4844 [L